MQTNRRHLLLGAASLALAAPSLRVRAQGTAPAAGRVDAVLQQVLEGRSAAGIAVLIHDRSGPLLSRTLGHRNVAGTAPMGSEDLFRLASMTKPVTSVAAMILVEEGKLALADPIAKHLPEFARLEVLRPDGSRVAATRPPTIAELLTHTAGFSYNFINRPGIVEAYRAAGVGDGLAEPERDTAEAMRRLAAAPLAFEPGAEWHYGLSTDVLGAVIEKVTGRPLGSVIAERIARPLGIETFVFRAGAGLRPRFVEQARPAQVTGALGTGVVAVTGREEVPFPATRGIAVLDPERVFAPAAYHSGGGGMSGSLGDYARFLRMLAGGGELDGARVLRAETVRAMTTNRTGALPINLRGAGWSFGYGFSVLDDRAAARLATPSGTYNWGGIYGTGFWVDPANATVGVVMTQTAIIGSGAITNAVREAWYAA